MKDLPSRKQKWLLTFRTPLPIRKSLLLTKRIGNKDQIAFHLSVTLTINLKFEVVASVSNPFKYF
jgi:hypothetical protein